MASKKPRGRKTPVLDLAPPPVPSSIYFGDKIKIERRYIVDGVLTCVTDKGKFGGVHFLGSQEHIAIEDKKGVRMIPLLTISEITVEEAAPRPAELKETWDPSII